MASYNTFFKLKGPEAHRLADMAGVLSDLRLSAETVAEIARRTAEPQLNRLILSALLDSAIIRYGRCYGTGGRTKFRIPRAWIDALPGDLRQAHSDFLDLRGKHIAHSVNDWEINTPVVRVWINSETGEASASAISVNRELVHMPRPEDLDNLRRLANAVGDRVATEMKVEQARLLEIAKKIPPDELRRRVREDRAVIPGRRKVGKPRGRT